MSLTPTKSGLWRRTLASAAAVALGSVALVGCGSSSDGGSSTSAAPATSSSGSSSSAVADLVPESIKASGQLRVAFPDGSAPLASVDENGDVVGMDPEIAQEMAELMGLELVPTAGTFDSQIPGLQAGKFDLAMGQYYVTAERLKSVDFVTDWRDYSSFATLNSNDWAPETAQDLCGRKIGVLKGSAEEASIEQLNEQCSTKMDVSAFPDQGASFLALNSGRVEAVVTGRGPLEGAKAQNPDIKITGEFGGGPCAIAVARNADSEAMLKAVQAALDELISNGTYAQILEKWGTGYGAAEKAEIFTADSTPPDYSAV